ncbi:PREDICTED: unknown [Prunus dulcis]|uniref:Uncharacterized protein n=1 Tax=Prunus dulcis TaxID=3755 RepID=A0A5E4F6I6_PRUDU|nr:uncharacterized protein LOC117616837 [Prunus dulcis]VVA22980.1 PREDICTED: unknown [Prunus dulcis]
MKQNDPPTLITIPSTTATPTVFRKDTSPSSSSSSSSSSPSSKGRSFLDKTRYKFWVLAAILLLAFWSMFTGSVTLKWSAGNLTRLSDDLDLPSFDDLDILEVEEREKVVRHMWDLYTQSSRSSSNRLPRFWQEAFEAAYEHLSSDVAPVRDAAVLEIAKMSIRSITLDPFPLQLHSASNRELKKRSKKEEESNKVATAVASS